MEEKGFFAGFINKHPEIYKFIKFSFVGIVTSVIEFGTYYILAYLVFKNQHSAPVDLWLLHYETRGLMYSFMLSSALGYIAAYIGNRKLTFASDANQLVSILLYVFMVVFTIFMTTYLGMELIKFTAGKGETIAKLGEYLAKPIVVLLSTVWTYPFSKYVVYRKKKQ